MQEYISEDTIIKYEIIGEGIPILFLHGWGVDRRLMSGCFEPIFEEDVLHYKRIYIDLPGMGMSVAGKNVKTSDDILDLIYKFIQDIVGEDIILAGESYGGYLARGFVNKYTGLVKSLILLCPLVYPGNRNGRTEPLTIMERDDQFLKTLTQEQYNSFTYMNVVLTKDVWDLFSRDILPAIEEQNREFLNNVLEGALSFEVDNLKNPFVGPCLIMVGKQDTEVGYKDQFKLLDKYPNATYCVLNKAGHNLQIEQPKMFQSIVREWLYVNH